MTNLPLLRAIAERLRPLLDEVVFVGGATTELFLTSPVSGRVRRTTDTMARLQAIADLGGDGA